MNAILKEERAIVTEFEGTTRDTIEEFIIVEGIPLKLIDTAGIRNAEDEVEKIGIKKSRKIAETADLIIAIFDSSKEFTEEDIEILDLTKGKKSIIVLNKSDLAVKVNEKDKRLKNASSNIVSISALNKTGIEKIYENINKLFNLNEINLDNDILITNIRQKNFIDGAIKNVEKAKETLLKKESIDIVAIFIKNILEDLGKITGEYVTEDIINEIFSKFCLGK